MSLFKYFFFFPLVLIAACSGGEKEFQVVRKDLVQAVYASGEVLPLHYYEVTAKAPGTIDSIFVTAGQIVKTGDTLLRIQNPTSELSLRSAENLYELAKKNASSESEILKQVEQLVNSAMETMLFDSVNYERYKRLNEKNIGSKNDFDQAVLKFKTSRYNYLIVKNQLDETKERLQIELKNALNNYLSQKSLAGDYVMLSAITGKVYNIIPKPGEIVNSNTAIIEIGALDDFEVELQVDESDIILIHEGQHVVYTLDALEDTFFTGTVRKIYPKVNTIDKTAKVTASVDPMNYSLYPGMSLEANIVILEKKNILAIPAEFLDNDGNVMVKSGGKNETRKIKTGIRDLEYVEVISGLNENDRIIKP